MTTTLCLLEQESDLSWIEAYARERGRGENLVVAVYSLLGRFASRKTALSCSFFEHLAWDVDNFAVSNAAKAKSLGWIDHVSDDAILQAFRFKGYPLARMHQFNVMQNLNWFLPSLGMARRLLEKTAPDKVLMGARENPFAGLAPIYVAAGPDGGFERECVRRLCLDRGVPVFSHDATAARRERHVEKALPRPVDGEGLDLLKALEADAAVRDWSFAPAKDYDVADGTPLSTATGKTFLFLAYGYYYMDDLLPCIDVLLDQGHGVAVVIIGGEVDPGLLARYRARGVRFFRKESFRLHGEQAAREGLDRLYGQVASVTASLAPLEAFFSDQGESYFTGLMEHVLAKEIGNMPYTILELLRTEILLDVFAPDAVFAHFSIGCYPGWGAFDVLPARKAGIPTLSLDHGVNGALGSTLTQPTTQYYAAYGESQRETIVDCCGFAPQNIRAVGCPRYERLAPVLDKAAEKKRLGLDPDRPVVVFCSIAELPGLYERQHAVYHNLRAMLAVKAELPQIQFLYRVHHGLDYRDLRREMQQLGVPDFFFESSLEPPHPVLFDLLRGTDLVIAQGGSSATEAVASATPVIYYCPRANVEPHFLGYVGIKVACEDTTLPGLVRQILDEATSAPKNRNAMDEYLARTLCGNDGGAGRRLADFLVEAADGPRVRGWDDWLQALDRSAFSFRAKGVPGRSFAQARRGGGEDDRAVYEELLRRRT